MTKDFVWILGRYGEDERWEVQGVFLTRGEADAAALPGEFFGPVEIGKRLPTERMDWPLLEVKGALSLEREE